MDTCTLCTAFPRIQLNPRSVALVLEFVARATELGDCLFCEEFLQRPLFDILRLVLLELLDELYSALQDAAFVLLTAGNYLGNFVNAFINRLAAPSLH